MSKRTVIVNDQDEIIGYKAFGTLSQADIYRVAALWVTNSQGDILLAQRQLGKRHDPGKWGPAVAGTVEEDETYEDNIIKEAAEEIGLLDIHPLPGPKRRTKDPYNYFTQWYRLTVDTPTADFVLQEEEVKAVRWMSPARLKQDLADHPERYIKGLDWCLENLG